jgi:hypothetical protein
MDQESHFQRQMEKLFFLKKVSLGGNNAVHVILLLEIYDVPTVTMNILDAATQPKSIFKVQFLQCCPARRHTKKQKCVFGLPKSLFLTLRLQGGEHQVIFLKRSNDLAHMGEGGAGLGARQMRGNDSPQLIKGLPAAFPYHFYSFTN